MTKQDDIIENLMLDWKKAGFRQDQIDQFVNEIFSPTGKEPEPPEPTDEEEDEEWDNDEIPIEKESDPPMPTNPGPEDPDDDSYDPERNVGGGGGGGAGSDPQCKPIFNPSVARMKRGKVYDRWIEGGQEGYDSRISRTKRNLSPLDLQSIPDGALGMHKFDGKMDINVSPGKPTRLFMPSNETYISGYTTNDGSFLDFYTDGLAGVYAKSLSGSSKRSITLEYTVWCKWSPDIDNLLYYYQKYDNRTTLFDAYEHGKKIDYDYRSALVTRFRRYVPGLLKIIDDNYFGDMIKVLGNMSSPGLFLDEKERKEKALLKVMKQYKLKKVVQVLAGYMMSFGCADIPEDGDMVVDCIRSREGSCRHRALAFFVCGVVMGIPIRYCCSDCHAYPETYFGNLKRWVGMDLGGCSPPQPPPSEPKPSKNIIEDFAKKLIMIGWKPDEDRYKHAIQAALTFQEP